MSKTIIMLGAGLILLPGCKPAANDATALLKGGDARICVAPEVEDTLREMIAPKPDLAKAYSVTFSNATLESYDPRVHKALCNTSVTVQGPGGPLIDHALLNMAVAPSARDDGQLLVTAQGIDAYHQQLVEDNAERAEQAASEEADKVAEEKLTALVKPGWLIGRWVGAKAGSDACSQKGYIDFVRGGIVRLGDGHDSQGRWTLVGRRINTISSNDTMSTLLINGETQDFRRCTPSEIRPAIQPEAAPDMMPSVDPPSSD
ncbi:MAG TPA: hypothetical protein QF469_01215, partial [Sphingomonas sanguinis]|uniref:hypothetical protein n=1 Tax=Sphingomonas sanguinis TaxID=33051 RepID=UPI002AC225F5|nr:hypothetical protein [Sphingomonas sanguinis]